jgi:hypothetical protein
MACTHPSISITVGRYLEPCKECNQEGEMVRRGGGDYHKPNVNVNYNGRNVGLITVCHAVGFGGQTWAGVHDRVKVQGCEGLANFAAEWTRLRGGERGGSLTDGRGGGGVDNYFPS